MQKILNNLKNLRTLRILFCISATFFVNFNISFADEFDYGNSNIKNSDEYNVYSDMQSYCPVYDPWEKFNRKVFYFNGVIDTILLRPVALTYDFATNDYMKARIGSFTSNVYAPASTVNYALQGNAEGFHKNFWRFMLNTTIGIGGLFDVASKFGISPKSQTFGSTLAHYGVSSGPYIVLPIFGGNNMRHATDYTFTHLLFNPLYYGMHQDFTTTNGIVTSVHSRAILLPFTNYISKNSLDPYATIRDTIHQKSEKSVTYPLGYKCLSISK